MADTPQSEERSEELSRWLSGFAAVAGPDTLLRFSRTSDGVIDLAHAHPSGLAQLMAGRKTRLSTLVRESQDYKQAARSARNIRAKIFEMHQDRGLDVGYLAAGTAVWTSAVGGKPQRVSAPILLAAVNLSLRPGGDDYELQVMEQANINPALIRHLKTVHGIVFDSAALARLAYSTARFDPQPVLERMETVLAPIHGSEVGHDLLVSTFADLPQNLDDPWINDAHPVIAALADPEAAEPRAPVTADEFAPLDERDPEEEFLLLDADPSQQLALDVIRAGESVVVSAPPGTGQTQTIVNALGELAMAGKSVLVVGERRTSLQELTERLSALGLGSLVLSLGASSAPAQLKAQLIQAIVRNEKAEEPQLAQLHQTIRERRHALAEHVASLHNVRPRWGCSPYQAMQALAQAVATDTTPGTTVRLKRSVLDSIKDRQETAGQLVRAAELGSFTRSTVTSRWHGARLLTRKEAQEAHETAARLNESVPALRSRMEEFAEQAQLHLGATFVQWGEQLELFLGMRDSLSRFSVEIFDRDVHDFIAATAPSAWRRERGIEMTSLGRAKLRKYAKEFVRPGVHILDLHESLKEVQAQREQWSKYAASQRHPVVPSGLAELDTRYADVARDLHALGEALKGTADGSALVDTPLAELEQRLAALSADTAALETLPERTLILDSLRGQGLDELLDDLAAREVPAEAVSAELDLAWWQSVLEAMISGDDYLAMSDGESLRKTEGEFRLADSAHIASGAARLKWSLAERWGALLETETRQAELLRSLLKDGRVSMAALWAQAPGLLSSLVPIWTVSPHALSRLLPAGIHFDAVVLVDAESIALRSALPAIARGTQVISFGDASIGTPRAFSAAVERAADGEGDPRPLNSTLDALQAVLPGVELRHAYRSVDEDLSLQLSRSFYHDRLNRLPDGHAVTGLDRDVVVEYLADGTGLPVPGKEAVESVAAEVNRVVDLVFEHARTRPRRSLAVVTTTLGHAARIGEAIRLQLPNHPLLADFFQGAGPESFRVVDLERAKGLVRDHVIFSLGFGRTPHGRALHSFGPLSVQGGRARFALAMSRARQHLHILSCFRPEDLDRGRLNHGAADFYDLLDRELGGNFSLGSHASRAASTDPALGEDALVADLADRLRVRGARVWHQYDGAIDVVAAADPLHTIGKDDSDIPTPVAIESDGTAAYRALSIRERSRLRPEHLERMGWRHVSLWTIEVFTDPSLCADRIASYLHLDGEEHPERGDSSTGFMQQVTLHDDGDE
ncbi:AAA domain-containing protein [Arthrobacter sp. NPDC090010]|uniref:AAA domain-containing protein n=1 Tax=Arthrobacter sp. NPDC090010 TaxID=3363942 RepID=UPI0037F5BCC5